MTTRRGTSKGIGPHHARLVPPHRLLRGVALTAVAVLTLGVSGAAAVAARLQGNIDRVDVSALVSPMPMRSDAPAPHDPSAGSPVNVLVLGSDERDGVNGEIGGVVKGLRSDTTMVMHISADRTRVSMVSIPRDSLVDIPRCTMTNGTTTRATRDMINAAFAMGWDKGGDMASAAACTINTVQQNTGVAIDHFAVVDFAGFQQMVQALGGVPLCIPVPMKDDLSGLDIPKAGLQTLDGPTALAYARTRYSIGDGSDINRIGNQQQLVAALVREVLSRDVLTNPTKLMPFLSAATSSLTTDSRLSLADMTGLAYQLRDIDRRNVTFMTIPWAPARSNKDRVEWTPAAAQVWSDMANDVPPTTYSPPAPTPSATPVATAGSAPATAAPPAPTAAPAQTKKAGKEEFSVADTTSVCS